LYFFLVRQLNRNDRQVSLLKITRTDVEHVALLARLELAPEELERFTGQLNAILDYVAVLDRADTSGVEPTAHVLPLKNVMRPDKVLPSLDRDLALANAPEAEDGFFKVARIIEG